LAVAQSDLAAVDPSLRIGPHRLVLDFALLQTVRFDSESIVEGLPYSSIECDMDMNIELCKDWTHQYIELDGLGWAQIFALLDTSETVVLEFEDGTFVCVCEART